MISASASTADESAAFAWGNTIPDSYGVRYPDGTSANYGNDSPAFTLVVRDHCELEWLLSLGGHLKTGH